MRASFEAMSPGEAGSICPHAQCAERSRCGLCEHSAHGFPSFWLDCHLHKMVALGIRRRGWKLFFHLNFHESSSSATGSSGARSMLASAATFGQIGVPRLLLAFLRPSS